MLSRLEYYKKSFSPLRHAAGVQMLRHTATRLKDFEILA